MEAKDVISSFWNRNAAHFDGSASHVVMPDVWRSAFSKALSTVPRGKALDVGAGTGACSLALLELGFSVSAIDIAENMLAVASRAAKDRGYALTTIVADAETYPFQPNSYDLVTMRNVVWTLTQPAPLLAALSSALKPGGALLLSDGYWRHPKADEAQLQDYPEVAFSLPYYNGILKSQAEALLKQTRFTDIESWDGCFEANPYPALGDPEFFVLTGRRSPLCKTA